MEHSGVSKATLYNTWPIIEKMGLVKETRRIGNATLCKWNAESPVAKMLSMF
jgi:Fe2+ or Zn2+ uptake regulation protein